MKIFRFFFIMTILLSFVAVSSGEQKPPKKSCKEHPKLSGSCFKVRGRMSFSNGTPSIRIWPIGTNRMFGISEGQYYLEGYENVPEELIHQISWGNAMYADFTLCPFTDDKLGKMRRVCVETAENISIRKWK
jgi:hypothetical protein